MAPWGPVATQVGKQPLIKAIVNFFLSVICSFYVFLFLAHFTEKKRTTHTTHTHTHWQKNVKLKMKKKATAAAL